MSIKLSPLLQHRLVITPALKEALAILQMPQIELIAYLQEEVEKNPFLEMTYPSHSSYDPSLLPHRPNLHEILLSQIREHFSNPTEKKMAITLLEELDERGFLPNTTPDSPILSILQTFEPRGVFARSLQECLLLQLDPSSFAFHIIRFHFEKLLHGRLKEIDLKAISHLHFRPADLFKDSILPPCIADLSISKNENGWIVSMNEEDFPKIYLRSDYNDLKLESKEEQKLLHTWMLSAKTLLRSLKRRKEILLEIGIYLTRKHADFLDHGAPLSSLSLRKISQELKIHESTLSRALSGKYVATPRGLLSLRSLISTSTENAKRILQRLIKEEERPMSDAEITQKLQKYGMKLSRRTVAKYRKALNIDSVFKRANNHARKIVSRSGLIS